MSSQLQLSLRRVAACVATVALSLSLATVGASAYALAEPMPDDNEVLDVAAPREDEDLDVSTPGEDEGQEVASPDESMDLEAEAPGESENLEAAAPDDESFPLTGISYSVAAEYDGLSYDTRSNCVSFVRYKVPSLPSGLWTVADKKAIINSYTPRAGAVAIYNHNHVSYVESVNGSTIVTLNGGFSGRVNGIDYTGRIMRISGTAAELDIAGYWVPGGPGPTPQPLTASWSIWTESVGNTNAIVKAQVNMSSTTQFSKAGVSIWNAAGTQIVNHSESTSVNLNYMKIWYDINRELGKTLTPGTTYTYQFWCVAGGNTYYSDKSTFKTTGSSKPTYRNGTVTTVPTGDEFMLVPRCAPSRLLERAYGNTSDGTEIFTNSISDELWYSRSKWKFVSLPDGSYAINSCQDFSSNLYMHLHGTGEGNGEKVHIWNGYGNDNSCWWVEKNTDGTYSFRNRGSDRYLDIHGAADANFVELTQYEGNGSNAQKFDLVPWMKSLGDANVAVSSVATQTYRGSAVSPRPTVTYMGKTLSLGTDYMLSYESCDGPGTGTVVVSGTGTYHDGHGRFVGTKKVSFTIVGDLSSATVTVANKTYTGKALKPAPTVKVGSTTLKSGTDYTVAYSNNTNAGTATVTVTGKGGYTGTSSATFAIRPASIAGATVTAADQTYTGKARKPAPTVKVGSATLKSGTDYTVAYSNNTKAGTATVTVTGKGNYTGTAKGTFRIVATQEMHRLYNPNSGEHFYTASTVERDALVRRGWTYEGVGWVAPVESSTPVHRLYNAVAGDHHYTTSSRERDALVKAGWKYEGVGWYSDDAKGVPLYRQYNPNAKTGSHNYTTSKAENDMLVKMGWVAEGIGWYGVKQ